MSTMVVEEVIFAVIGSETVTWYTTDIVDVRDDDGCAELTKKMKFIGRLTGKSDEFTISCFKQT